MILNQYGRPYTTFAAAAERHSPDRPFEPTDLRDIGKLVPRWDRETLLSASRRLYLNMGVVRGGIMQKNMYAVGRAWLPTFTGSDSAFGDVARDMLVNEWMKICDVRGGCHDLQTILYETGIAIDRDGEAFILLTEQGDGYPALQQIPAHRVGARAYGENIVQNGTFQGYAINDGIIVNELGRPIAYRVLGDSAKDDKDVPAQDMIHLYDPDWQEQFRGLPALTHALNDLKDSLMSHNWERMAILMMSSYGIVIQNEKGGPDPDDIGVAMQQAPAGSTEKPVTSEMMEQGRIQYFRAGTGSKIETISQDRPGQNYVQFQDRIIRSAMVGYNWPYSMVWKPEGNGVVTREMLQQADRSIQDRQDLLDNLYLRAIGYAVAKLQKMGRLPQSADWWRWKHTYPPRPSVDYGRDGQTHLKLLRAGALTFDRYFGFHGDDEASHWKSRAKSAVLRKRAIKEAEAEYGETIEDHELFMFADTDVPDQPATEPQPQPAQPDQNQ